MKKKYTGQCPLLENVCYDVERTVPLKMQIHLHYYHWTSKILLGYEPFIHFYTCFICFDSFLTTEQ